MDRVRVGVIGLGAIAQAIHLPNLARLWDRYEIVSVCDVDPDLTDAVASNLGRQVRVTTDPAVVVQAPDLDAVLVLASGPHSPVARAALEAGKHAFVEKPLALTVAEAMGLHELARSSDLVLQVGYMKRHDAMVVQAAAEIETVEPQILRITVVHPTEEIQQRHLSIRRSSVPADVIASSRRYDAETTPLAIGSLPEAFGWFYREVALGSIIHQLAVVRLLLGSLPATVEFCRAWPPLNTAYVTPARVPTEPPNLVAIAALPSGGWLELDWIWAPGAAEYVERYEAIGRDSRLVLDLPTPYALDQRSLLRVDRQMSSRRQRSEFRTDHRTGFQVELEAFHAAIVSGSPFPSDAAGAAADIAFLEALVGALAKADGFQPAGEAGRP